MNTKILRSLLIVWAAALAISCYASPTFLAVASVPAPTGLATHGASGLVAATYNGGLTAIAPDGSTMPFSNLAGITGEPNLVECPASLPAYGAHTFYVPVTPSIAHVSSDGSSWVPFANIPSSAPLISLAFDTTGLWGSKLYALTEDGSVWLVQPNGAVSFLINVGPLTFPPYYAEGLTIWPVNPALGPLSGSISVLPTTNRPDLALSGSVVAIHYDRTHNPKLYTTTHSTGLHSVEGLSLNPGGCNLYVASAGYSEVYGMSAADLAPYAGTVTAIVEDDDPSTGTVSGIYSLAWNGSSFTPVSITPAAHPFPGNAVLEGSVFTKNGIAGIPTAP